MAKWYVVSVISGISSSPVHKTYTITADAKLEALRKGQEKATKLYPGCIVNTSEVHLIRA